LIILQDCRISLNNRDYHSLMPEGFEKTISPAEMADLIAFILTLQD
jgi:hypothetical protein